jgi:hypothetical protein
MADDEQKQQDEQQEVNDAAIRAKFATNEEFLAWTDKVDAFIAKHGNDHTR